MIKVISCLLSVFILIKYRGRIAQLAEQLTLNQRVVGSSPTAPTNIPKYKQLFSSDVFVYYHLSKKYLLVQSYGSVRITKLRISDISSIANRMPSRPSPESLTPPYGMLSTRYEGTSPTTTPPTSSLSQAC